MWTVRVHRTRERCLPALQHYKDIEVRILSSICLLIIIVEAYSRELGLQWFQVAEPLWTKSWPKRVEPSIKSITISRIAYTYSRSAPYLILVQSGRFYGVVPKGLLTFLCSLYKEVAETTPGILIYRFERQSARENISSLQKYRVLNWECRILSQESSDSFILYFNVTFHGKWADPV